MPDSSQLPLRDIHLPETVSAWPPAPGWWITPLLLLLLLLLAWFLYRRLSKKTPWQRQAFKELQVIEEHYQQERDGQQLVKALSGLIRRSAMSHQGRQATAGLQGEAWLLYLDSVMEKPAFHSETGRLLIDSLWRPEAQISPQQADHLIHLTRDWLQRLPRSGEKPDD